MFPINTHKLTKTQSTKETYFKKGQQLVNKYEKTTGYTWQDDPIYAIQWITEQRTQWKYNTWRLYKAALKEYMKTNQWPIETIEFLDNLKTQSDEFQKTSTKTSAKKLKKFPPEDLSKILKYIDKQIQIGHSPHHQRIDVRWIILKYWLPLSILTGLRPTEWETATLHDKTLIVQNAKNTNERSFGPERHILLTQVSQQELEDLQTLLTMLKQQSDINRTLKLCQRLLYHIGKIIWPRRNKKPSLYSARHQFCANAKAARIGTPGLAALMGHKTNRTAIAHYARIQSGIAQDFKVSPSPDDIKKIKIIPNLGHPLELGNR